MPTPTSSTATTFFKASLEQGALSHGYVLYGKSIQTQYNLAMFMAQVINCEALNAKEHFHPCGECRACKWIQANAHPSVVTLSPLTYLDEASEGKPRKGTLISVGQIRRLISQISQHPRTGEERVVIFTNAERYEPFSNKRDVQHPVCYPVPSEWAQENDHLRWKPLTSSTFSAQSANAFLKHLEEPTPGIRYFFLTRQPETLLATVVSRCQSLYVPPDDAIEESQAEQRIPYEASLIQWIEACLAAKEVSLPAQPATQAFIQLAEDEHVKPKRLFEDMPYILSTHRNLLFGEDYTRYLAWQAETHKALHAMVHYVQPANALWQMLHNLCEQKMR